MLVYTSYGFHTGICFSEKRTVVNQYTMLKKNLKLVWSVKYLRQFSLSHISKYFRGESRAKENLDRMGEIHDCELKHGLGSKFKCKISVPIENSSTLEGKYAFKHLFSQHLN